MEKKQERELLLAIMSGTTKMQNQFHIAMFCAISASTHEILVVKDYAPENLFLSEQFLTRYWKYLEFCIQR